MKYNVVILLSLLIICGFKGEPDSTKTILYGNIKGLVILYDEYVNQIFDASGVTVSLEGTSLSTVTSRDGSWIIENVPAGIYNIKFSKAGYPTMKYYNRQFVGGGTLVLDDQQMERLPSLKVTFLRTYSSKSPNSIIAEGSVSSNSTIPHKIIVFFSSEPITLSGTMLFNYAIDGFVDKDSVNFKTYANMEPGSKFKYGFESGEKLYAVAFTIPYWWYWFSAYNPVTKRYEINPDEFNFSNIDSVIVP
jgi:hypothetical protein